MKGSPGTDTGVAPDAPLHLRVANQLAALDDARHQVLAYLAQHALDPKLLYQLELVLEETLMNRVWHAFPAGRGGETEITVTVHADELELVFSDDGLPFDPLASDPRPAPTSLADAQIGGLGLMLTRKAARSCDYVRRDHRNVFTVRLAR